MIWDVMCWGTASQCCGKLRALPEARAGPAAPAQAPFWLEAACSSERAAWEAALPATGPHKGLQGSLLTWKVNCSWALSQPRSFALGKHVY